jgi:hypothetical protein
MRNRFNKMAYRYKMITMAIFISLFLIDCVPESHWKKKYGLEFRDVCILQDAVFSSLLFGIQGMQKTLSPNRKIAYQDWPLGFDSLIPVIRDTKEYYLLNNKDTNSTQTYYRDNNQIEIYLENNWPNPGSISHLIFFKDISYGGKYSMTLTMKDTTSDGKWNFMLNIYGQGYSYEYNDYDSWQAFYEVTWHPNNPFIFEDDELSFSGLGKSKSSNSHTLKKHALSFIIPENMYLRSGVPGIYGNRINLFPYNLPMASFSLAKIESQFPESYPYNAYRTTLARGQSQGHFWNEHYNYSIYSSLLYQFRILKSP